MEAPCGFTFFYTKASPFSNFHPAPFAWDAAGCPVLAEKLPRGYAHARAEFNCSEQAFMYAKALFFGDFFVAGQILATPTPFGQKKLGRAVKGFEADAWATASAPIVESILLEKFGQNPALGRQLRDTGDTLIAEASPKDRIWGIGLSAADPRALDIGQWRGENRLGRVLMRVRARLAAAGDA